MSRSIPASMVCAATGLAVAGCASAPVQTAGNVAGATGHMIYSTAGSGAHALYTTGGDVYSGVGAAAKQPFRDLNMLQDPIPPVLLRAESKPYDLASLSSCASLVNQVAELDLALGPDLDSPKDRGGDRFTKGADAAASAALEAATSAAEGFLPMRSIIKTVSGATRYEKHVQHAVLAGTERRSFLKAIGMAHNCGWPAEPLGYDAASVAAADARWSAPGSRPAVQTAAAAAPTPAGASQSQTVAVASAVSPSHPDVQAIAVSTSTAGEAPVTEVYMVANPAAGRSGSVRTVTVANLGTGAGASAVPSVQVSAPSLARSGAVIASATAAHGGQAITVTAPTSAQGSQVRAMVATSTLSAPAGRGASGMQTVSVMNSTPGGSSRTVEASSALAASATQTLTVADPLRNAAPSAQVAANGPIPARRLAGRPVRVVTSPTAYQPDMASPAGGEAFTSSPTAPASGGAAAPWATGGPGGR